MVSSPEAEFVGDADVVGAGGALVVGELELLGELEPPPHPASSMAAAATPVPTPRSRRFLFVIMPSPFLTAQVVMDMTDVLAGTPTS